MRLDEVVKEAACSWREAKGYHGGRFDPYDDNIEHAILGAIKLSGLLADHLSRAAAEACVKFAQALPQQNEYAFRERCIEVGRRILKARKPKERYIISPFEFTWGIHDRRAVQPVAEGLTKTQARAVAAALNALEPS